MLVRRVLAAAIFSATLLLGGWGWPDLARAAQDRVGNEGGSGEVTLRIAGDEGTRFSGACSVGQEEHNISGRVPQSFEFSLNGSKLVCEIRKQGAQDTGLQVVLKDENTRYIQRSAGSGETVMRLVYEDGTVSSMVSSISQTTSIADGETSSSSSEGKEYKDKEAERSGNGRESLADRIQKRVDEILEQALQ